MDTQSILVLTLLFFLVAVLYSSVGHAGASGYLAAMGLLGVAPAIMKPTALTLNILVAAIASIQFYRAGFFSRRIFWPFAVTSIPFAYVGGTISLPPDIYKQIVGIILLYSAIRLFFTAQKMANQPAQPFPIWIALFLGVVLGLLSGMVGVGGGIFLSPLLLFLKWGETRQVSAVAAVFILVNSISGLTGHVTHVSALPSFVPLWVIAVVIGGWIGSEYGSKRLNTTTLRRILAVVLIIAGIKMILI